MAAGDYAPVRPDGLREPALLALALSLGLRGRALQAPRLVAGGQRVLGRVERLGLVLERLQALALCLGLDVLLPASLGPDRGLLAGALDLRRAFALGVAPPRG